MIHERKRIAKIAEELTIFFFSVGATKMNSGIEYDGRLATITFESNFDSEYQCKVADLEKYLNEPRNTGMEDIYWELAGSGDPGEPGELLLIGMMIDRAEMKLEDSFVQLKLYKELM